MATHFNPAHYILPQHTEFKGAISLDSVNKSLTLLIIIINK